MHMSVEETTEEMEALQAQLEELDGDVYEGMCALGIETDRVAALVKALAAVGVDPNPILDEIDDRYFKGAAAQIETDIPSGSTILQVDKGFNTDTAHVLSQDAEQEMDRGHESQSSAAGSVALLTGAAVWGDRISGSANCDVPSQF